MANEDVIERMKRFLNPESPMYRSEGRQIMEALAAALREAREDTKKLDWALRNGLYHDGVYIDTREELAAEMKLLATSPTND